MMDLFKPTNAISMRELSALNEIIEFHCCENDPPLIELFSITEDKLKTTFALITYINQYTDFLALECDVNACLLYFDGKKFQRANKETLKRFEDDQPAFKYKWFNFD